MRIEKICLLSNGTPKEEYNIPNVIRCKDCKYFIDENGCILKSADYTWEEQMDADDFCSRGEKKDE